MAKDVPYFPLYAANILAAKSFKLMTLKERGLWITLQMECWVNGDVPANNDELAQYLGIPFNEMAESLTNKQYSFVQKIKDILISPELEEYRKKYDERRMKQIQGGIKGAERKKIKQRQTVIATEGKPLGQPEGVLNYINSSSIELNKVISNQLLGERPINEEAQAWVKDYDAHIDSRKN